MCKHEDAYVLENFHTCVSKKTHLYQQSILAVKGRKSPGSAPENACFQAKSLLFCGKNRLFMT